MPGYVESYIRNDHKRPPTERSFEQGESYARKALQQLVAQDSHRSQPHELLNDLRASATAVRLEISAGQHLIGSAWQDTNFTRGARHGLNQAYLELKTELGLSHLPKLARDHSLERSAEYGLSW